MKRSIHEDQHSQFVVFQLHVVNLVDVRNTSTRMNVSKTVTVFSIFRPYSCNTYQSKSYAS